MDNVYIAEVKNDNIKESVSFCLDKIIDKNIKHTDTVLLKPNFLNDSPADTGITTDLRVIRAVIELLKEKDVQNIILAEAGFTNTDKIFHNLNIYDLKNYGIKIINLEESERVTIEYLSAYIFKKMVLPRPVIDSDVIITIPSLKTHAQTTVTLGIKNFFGFLYLPQRKTAHTLDLDKSIIDIYTCLKEHLGKHLISLVDAIYALSGRLGPNIGTPIKMDLLIGSDNLINCDSACVRLMDCNPRQVRHLLLCEETELGNLDDYQIIGEPIDKVKKTFTIPTTSVTLYPHVNKIYYTLFKKQPFLKYPEFCTVCGICKNACPKDCIDLTNKYPIIDYAECIGCLCCTEGCPNKAYENKIRFAFLLRTLEKLYKLAQRIAKMLKSN